MKTEENVCHSRVSDFKHFEAGLLSTNMHLKEFKTTAQQVECIS